MKDNKPHINSILKPGAKLNGKRKLTKKDLAMIEKTIEQQKLIPPTFRYPYT